MAGKNVSIGCTDRQFRCADGTACIHITFLCDGEAECPDKSDEDPRECFLKGEFHEDISYHSLRERNNRNQLISQVPVLNVVFKLVDDDLLPSASSSGAFNCCD